MIKTEQDVRRWLKKVAGDRVFWIEAAPGANPGLPDAYLATPWPVWLELKLGRQLVHQDCLRYDLRASQKQTIRRLIAAGQAVGLLVGVKSTSQLYVVQVSEHTIDGRSNLTDDVLFSCTSNEHIEPCYLSSLITESDCGGLPIGQLNQMVNAI